MPIERQDNSVKNAVNRVVSETNADAGARTLAGSAIEMVWDAAAGKAASQKDRVERAHRADEYAELAADTVACLPKFKTVTGALARGVLLADVSGNKTVGQWTANFASNVAEGALLNRAGKLANPESTLTKALSSGRPLTAELAMHGTTGAAFGAVKAGFNLGAARDESGQFSTLRYLENFALSTATGAVIGVPAGAFGSRVGKVVSDRLGVGVSSALSAGDTAAARAGAVGTSRLADQSLLSLSIKHAATGAAGGFAGGAVFGGVDSLKESKSFGDVLAGTLKGGTIGLLTGAAAGAFEPRGLSAAEKHDVRRQELQLAASADREGEILTAKRLHSRGDGETQKIPEISSLNFNGRQLLDARLTEMDGSMRPARTEQREFFSLHPDMPKDFERFKGFAEKRKADKGSYDFSDFIALAPLEKRQVNIYESEHTQGRVVIPSEYDRELDQVRSLRKQTEKHTPFHDLPNAVRVKLIPELESGDASALAGHLSPAQIAETIPFVQAMKGLREHPLGDRILPEDMMKLMNTSPNPNLVKEVVLYDRPDYQNIFSAYRFDLPDFKAAASAAPGGKVTFYEGKRTSTAADSFYHEWSHQAKWTSPEMSRFFDMATALDKTDIQADFKATRLAREADPDHPSIQKDGIYFPREYASVNQDENWAVSFGDHILHGDADELYMYVQQAPVRAMVLSTALETHLKQNPAVGDNQMLTNFKKRVQYIDAVARPMATEVLSQKLASGTVEERFMAARMLGFYGSDEARAALIKAGTDPANSILPGNVSLAGRGIRESEEFNPGNSRKPMTVAQTALEAAYRLSGHNDTQRERVMVEEAMSSPSLRQAMIDSWFELPMRNQGYRQFLEAYDKPGAPLAMQKLIEGRFRDDAFGSGLAFDEILRQTGGDKELQAGYLLRNLEYVPSLRREALDRLLGISRDGDVSRRVSNKILDHLAESKLRTGDRGIDEGIAELKDNLLRQQKLERILKEMAVAASSEKTVSQIRELGALQDMRSIVPLIRKAVFGDQFVQTEAMSALSQFPATIVNYYARGVRSEYQGNAALSRRLDDLMARRGAYARTSIDIASVFSGDLK